MKYLKHPYIKENAIELRDYQINIANSAIHKNTLVVLPTGMGKTIIAVLVIAKFLEHNTPKILMLAPTRPLVKQHEQVLKTNLKNFTISYLTGQILQKKRPKIWKENDIIISTPQVIQSDLRAELINPADIKLVLFDEAHKAIGNYAYTYLGEVLYKYAHIVGFTASPGSKKNKFEEIMRSLHIEHLEIRSENDLDVTSYVQEIKVRWYLLDMPPQLKPLHQQLRRVYEDILSTMKNNPIFPKKRITKTVLIELQKKAIAGIKAGKKEYYSLVSKIAMAIKVDQAIEYLETQGFEACKEYLEKIVLNGNVESGSRADKKLIRSVGFVNAVLLARKITTITDPKQEMIEKLVKQQLLQKPNSRIIVFSNYRNVNQAIYDRLKNIENCKPLRFIGQSSKGLDKGLSQKEQSEIIRKFRKGTFNVLVSTQIGEEGLDIPETDLVIFNEPIPSEIRSIQRRGRTGRKRVGAVAILIYKNTRDEVYHWVSRRKEKRMKYRIESMKNDEIRGAKKQKKRGQLTLFEF